MVVVVLLEGVVVWSQGWDPSFGLELCMKMKLEPGHSCVKVCYNLHRDSFFLWSDEILQEILYGNTNTFWNGHFSFPWNISLNLMRISMNSSFQKLKCWRFF